MYIIYKHTNLISGKCYVGQTKKSIEKRWLGHISSAIMECTFHFSNAIRKYPLESWTHEIIEEGILTKKEANMREIYWIEYFKSTDPLSGYNMTKGGEGGQTCTTEQLSLRMKGKPKTREHRQRMREAAERYWANAPKTDVRREKLAERNRSIEGREKAAIGQQKYWSDPAKREAWSKIMSERHISDETRQRNSDSQRELWDNPDYREKMKIAFQNRRPATEEEKLARKLARSKRMTGKKRGPCKKQIIKKEDSNKDPQV